MNFRTCIFNNINLSFELLHVTTVWLDNAGFPLSVFLAQTKQSYLALQTFLATFLKFFSRVNWPPFHWKNTQKSLSLPDVSHSESMELYQLCESLSLMALPQFWSYWFSLRLFLIGRISKCRNWGRIVSRCWWVSRNSSSLVNWGLAISVTCCVGTLISTCHINHNLQDCKTVKLLRNPHS